jgi:hypothetical protein
MPTTSEPIDILPGVEPSTDRSATTTRHYTFTKHIRFKDGLPEKIGGWVGLTFDENNTIAGAPRSIFSYKLSGLTRYVIGTNSRLYGLFGSALTNITPLIGSPTTIANSLDTYYGTLVSNPIATVDGSTTITITDAGHKLRAGDTVTLSGASSVNGIPDTDINAAQFVRSTTTNAYTIIVNTAATSTGSGGGASVVRATGYITVNATAHGMSDGDRVGMASAATTGGITDTQINRQFLVRNTTANTFDIYTAGTATSAVTAGGGASTTYDKQIPAGNVNTQVGQGYGLGLYGVGLYGVSKASSGSFPPRIWSHDRFGDLVVSTPGDGGKLYSWDSSTLIAPAVVANSPPAVNYVFVSDSIVVCLGYDTGLSQANGNGISWSSQGTLTNWSTLRAGSDSIEGAGTFLTHVSARGENLLFTENQTYTFRFIGGEFVWRTRLLDSSVGIIARNARCTARGDAYWMGLNNFYRWRGGSVEVVPSNTGIECTALNYIFSNLNYGQRQKIFCWFNERYGEVWWHYPSATSNEPDRVIRFNVDTQEWVIDEMPRTAAEYPSIIEQTPYLINIDGVLYSHESGVNDDGAGMDWQLDSHYIYGGTDTIRIEAILPDQDCNADFTMNLSTLNYPRGGEIQSENYTITPTTERLPVTQNGRYWKISLNGNALNQTLTFGRWYQEVARSTPK